MDKTDQVITFIKTHGVACGGNWAQMLMTAIQNGLPSVWEKLEDRSHSFDELWKIIEENIE